MRQVWALMILVLLPAPSFAADFLVMSSTIKEQGIIGNEHVFNGFGCTGRNVSPELKWEHAPKDVKSFAEIGRASCRERVCT